MRVDDLLITDFPHIYEDETIDEAIDDLVENPVHSLPVFSRDNTMIGELSQTELLLEIIGDEEIEGDFDLSSIQHLLSSGASTVQPMVNRHELSVRPDDHVLEAVKLMYDEDLSTLPVEDQDGSFVGIITDIVILEHYDELN
jgi:predicted transcriptional regulator